MIIKKLFLLFLLTIFILFACDYNDNVDNNKIKTNNNEINNNELNIKTIYQIQQNIDVNQNDDVIINNVIVTSPVVNSGFFVQESTGGTYSGIYIYIIDSTGLSLDIGDIINIDGNYQEFYELSQIVVENTSKITITGNTSAPEPVLVNSSYICTAGTSGEAYEGVLVKIENAEVSNNDLGNGEWEVDNLLIIDDLFYTENAVNNTTYSSITGCLYHSYMNFKIEPRFSADLIP